ncbi:M28 family peptidase [Paenibacillus dokdonensis]|uniref:M28 family peptidase n=1 Tax=Paenibacillus dokdonensis TaxID=2567944 RepID=UPI0010A795DB
MCDVTLNNIIATLKGSKEGKALMMSAHYDSVTDSIWSLLASQYLKRRPYPFFGFLG